MKILDIHLQLEEPVLVSKPGIDPNTDESLNYLPGSVIRGAIATQFARKHKQDGNWPDGKYEEFKRLFLSEAVRFLNAYPSQNGQRLLPTPNHWVVEKDPLDQANQWQVIDLAQPKQGEIKQTKALGGPFHQVITKEGTQLVYTRGVQFEVAVHNARNREMGRAIPEDRTNRSALFRYHALAKGQSFIARIIIADDADVVQLEAYLNGHIWLGRSSSAGYGRTKIIGVTELTSSREMIIGENDVPANQPILVYFTSEAIIRHPENGQTGAYLVEWLNKKYPEHQFSLFKTKDKNHLVFNKMGWVGGFNVTWGLPLPQTWAILKGSVWVLQSEKPFTRQEMQALEASGIGERRAEGFGSVVIAAQGDWPDALQLPRHSESGERSERKALQFTPLTNGSANLLDQMNTRIARQELDRHLASALNGLYVNRIRLSNSQLARIRLNVRKKDKADTFSLFRTYVKGTEERKSADDQFRKSRIQGQGLREWILGLINEPTKIWDIMKLEDYGWEKGASSWQRYLLGADAYQLSNELAEEYTVRLIDGLCERAQKEGR